MVSHSLDGTRIHFEFYSEHGPIFRAGTVKTFGLAVNGRVIRSLESDLAKEAFLLHKVMPILAVIMLAISFWRWPRPKNTVLMPDGSVAVPAVDKGFALSWVNLSPRRKFLRTCWVSGIAVVIVLLAKPKLFWISGTLLGCAFVIWRQYGEWKDKSASPTAHER